MEKEETGKKRGINGNTEKIILRVLLLVILAGACIGGYYFWNTGTYFSTDNAKVLAKMYSVTPQASGRLTRWTVSEGDSVTENEVIGRIENTTYLRSPVNGKVVKSNVNVNQLVSPSAAAAIIADISEMYIQANIEETEIMKIREGQKVSIKLDAFPGKVFSGLVKEIDMLTQDALGGSLGFTTSGTYTKITKLIPVKISLDDNIDLSLILGTNANIKIRLR